VLGKGAAWLAGLPPRVAFWCLRQVAGTTLLSVKTVLALLGEEVRRWVVVAVWGLLLFGLYLTFGAVSTGARQVLAFGVLCWFWGAFRAGERTVHNRLAAVRAREFYKKLDQRTGELGDKIGEAVRSARSGEGGVTWMLNRRRPDAYLDDNGRWHDRQGRFLADDDPTVTAARRRVRPGSTPTATVTLDEIGQSPVTFEPVFQVPWRRRQR
jgi:hypothetical protein